MARDRGENVILLLLDVSAAFDTICHEKLFEIMKLRFGISGRVLEWFKSYMSNRRQKVKVENENSDEIGMSMGIPQGSKAGPIIFSMYLRSLYDLLESLDVNFHGYADDNQIYFSFENVEEANARLSVLLQKVQDWFVSHKLKLNTDKTKIIMLSKHRIDFTSDITIAQPTLKFSELAKNLGVLFDTEISYQSQITKCCQICYYYLHLLARHKNEMDKNTLKKISESYVLARLNYCVMLYAELPDYMLNKLQKVQNYAVRIITGAKKHDHITPFLISLSWLSVKQFIKYRIIVTVYKCMNHVMPDYMYEMLSLYTPCRTLRSENAFLLEKPTVKTKYGERAFQFIGPKYWNEIPNHIKFIPNLYMFKKALKYHLLEISTN